MKALFLKDLYALKESRMLLVLTVFLALVMGCMGNIAFVQSYVAAISAVLVLNVINYDELDNGYSFLFTLPISRRQYVMEKYGFGLTTAFAGWCAILILSKLASLFSTESLGMAGWMVSVCVLFAMLLMQALLIPVQIRFGGQKGKIAILLVFAASFGCAMLVVKVIGGSLDEGFLMLWEFFSECSLLQILGTGIVAIAIAGAVSFFCSLRIMDHKAF